MNCIKTRAICLATNYKDIYLISLIQACSEQQRVRNWVSSPVHAIRSHCELLKHYQAPYFRRYFMYSGPRVSREQRGGSSFQRSIWREHIARHFTYNTLTPLARLMSAHCRSAVHIFGTKIGAGTRSRRLPISEMQQAGERAEKRWHCAFDARQQRSADNDEASRLPR